jgi:hypothetical protein
MQVAKIDRIQLCWSDDGQSTLYTLFTVDTSGQVGLVGTFEQGPFDTSLEVAQWVWRRVARLVPPAIG